MAQAAGRTVRRNADGKTVALVAQDTDNAKNALRMYQQTFPAVGFTISYAAPDVVAPLMQSSSNLGLYAALKRAGYTGILTEGRDRVTTHPLFPSEAMAEITARATGRPLGRMAMPTTSPWWRSSRPHPRPASSPAGRSSWTAAPTTPDPTAFRSQGDVEAEPLGRVEDQLVHGVGLFVGVAGAAVVFVDDFVVACGEPGAGLVDVGDLPDQRTDLARSPVEFRGEIAGSMARGLGSRSPKPR